LAFPFGHIGLDLNRIPNCNRARYYGERAQRDGRGLVGMIKERIDALRKREQVCWDMSEVFLHAKDAHGLHDMGVEIQGIQWAIRELEGLLRK
jgi:hypothetical protein